MVNTMTVPGMSRLPVNFSWPANGYALVGMPLMQGGLPGEVLSEGPLMPAAAFRVRGAGPVRQLS